MVSGSWQLAVEELINTELYNLWGTPNSRAAAEGEYLMTFPCMLFTFVTLAQPEKLTLGDKAQSLVVMHYGEAQDV